MNYFGGESPHYSVDHLGTEYAELMFECEGDVGRMYYYENEIYKAVSSSIVIGAVANGDSLNLKPFFMSEIVNCFLEYNPPTGLEENLASPISGKNFPNPFTGNTSISYTLVQTGTVQLNIYDAGGRLVKQMLNEEKPSGQHTITWDATNDRGMNVPGGFYFYELSMNGYSTIEKMILVK